MPRRTVASMLVHVNLRNNDVDKPTLPTLPVQLQIPRMRGLLYGAAIANEVTKKTV